MVDDEGKPVEIKARVEGTGENMIENFMVAANESVGSFIFYQNLPGIYRVHDKPDEERLERFFQFLTNSRYFCQLILLILLVLLSSFGSQQFLELDS